MPGRRLTGRCECGRVEYRVADAFRYALNCHCSRCRAATGSAFKPLAGIEREHFEVTAGPHSLMVHGGRLPRVLRALDDPLHVRAVR